MMGFGVLFRELFDAGGGPRWTGKEEQGRNY
jgi:hypothetical protein